MNRETPSFPDRAAEKHLRVALGAERFALLPFRFPRLSIIVAVFLAIVAVLGIQRIKIDDALGQLFRSDTPEFKLYQQVTHEFPSSEYDVLVVVEGKSLLERELGREVAPARHRSTARGRRARHYFAVFRTRAASAERRPAAAAVS